MLTLTLFVLVLVGFAGFCGWRFWQSSRALETRIQAFADQVADSRNTPPTVRDDVLERVRRRYRQTFVESGKTDEEASTYFTEQSVVGATLNLRFWRAVPNLLVGIGILGTFVGLTVGIRSFETQSVESVRTSIETLLAGMSTAFVSSIVGMLLSLIFNMFEKWRFGQVNQALTHLCGELDAQYLIQESDLKALEREQSRDLLSGAFEDVLLNAFSYTDEEERILPAHVLRDLRREAREQSKTLKSFSTDLADGIKMSTMTIEQLGGHVGEAFKDAMEHKLTPAMQEVQDAVGELRSEKMESNEEMVENVVERLSSTLDNVSAQFQESLTGGALDQLEQTADTVAEMGELLDSFQSDFTSMSNDLKESLEGMAEKTGQEAQQATSSMRAEVEAAAQTMREEASAATESMRKHSEGAAQSFRSELERATESVGGEIESLQHTSAELLDRQQKSAQTVQALLEDGGNVADRLNETASSLQDTLSRLRRLSETLEHAADRTRESGSALQESTTQLREHHREWLSAEKETLGELESALGEMQSLSATYVRQFDDIRGGLQDIFGEVEQGLSDYQNTTRESINNYLSDLADNLDKATSALNGTVMALDESFEELHDLVDKMNGSTNGRR
jgi:chromosome segregation ATPase